jgi:hypothetical protein
MSAIGMTHYTFVMALSKSRNPQQARGKLFRIGSDTNILISFAEATRVEAHTFCVIGHQRSRGMRELRITLA